MRLRPQIHAAEPLRYDPATGKVWSVGLDGIDEGGKGDDDFFRNGSR